MVPALLILGSSTGVGKTAFVGALSLAWRHMGQLLTTRKPFAAGSWDDTDMLGTLGQLEEPRELVTPYFSPGPLVPAPDWANWDLGTVCSKVAACIESVAPQNHVVLVEGIGGVRSPVSDHADLLMVAGKLQLPIVLVTDCELGTLSATLLCLQAAATERVRVLGLILNRFRRSDPVHRHNIGFLRAHASTPDLVVPLPFVPSASTARVVAATSSHLLTSDEGVAERLRVLMALEDRTVT